MTRKNSACNVNIKGTETKALKQDEYVSAVLKDVHFCAFLPLLTAHSPVLRPALLSNSLVKGLCISLLIQSVLPNFSDVVLSAHTLILTVRNHILTRQHNVLVDGTALLLLAIFV